MIFSGSRSSYNIIYPDMCFTLHSVNFFRRNEIVTQLPEIKEKTKLKYVSPVFHFSAVEVDYHQSATSKFINFVELTSP